MAGMGPMDIGTWIAMATGWKPGTIAAWNGAAGIGMVIGVIWRRLKGSLACWVKTALANQAMYQQRDNVQRHRLLYFFAIRAELQHSSLEALHIGNPCTCCWIPWAPKHRKSPPPAPVRQALKLEVMARVGHPEVRVVAIHTAQTEEWQNVANSFMKLQPAQPCVYSQPNPLSSISSSSSERISIVGSGNGEFPWLPQMLHATHKRIKA